MRLRDITKGAVRRPISKAYGLPRAIMDTAVDDDLIEAGPVHIRGVGYRPKRRRLEPATIEELTFATRGRLPLPKLMARCVSEKGLETMDSAPRPGIHPGGSSNQTVEPVRPGPGEQWPTPGRCRRYPEVECRIGSETS